MSISMSMDLNEEIEEEIITEYSTPSCSIESDLCICKGLCPEFINSWEDHNSNNILGSGVATCISTKIGDSTRIDSGNVIVNGKVYKPQTFGACPNNIMTSAGTSTTVFSSSLLVLSVLVSTIIGLELVVF